MIDSNPFLRLLTERGISMDQIINLSGLDYFEIFSFKNGKNITQEKLDVLCKILNCQPCDLIAFHKSDSTGHWEWVEDSEK